MTALINVAEEFKQHSGPHHEFSSRVILLQQKEFGDSCQKLHSFNYEQNNQIFLISSTNNRNKIIGQMLNGDETTTVSIRDEFIQINNDDPGVINYTLLMDLAVQQAPTGEAGRLYREEGIKLDEIKEIRIEFLRILKIDYLWYMKSLTKLSLAHNAIKKIEALDALIELRELDVSFNSIKTMENLNCLLKLEILLLAGNEICTIGDIDNLKNLTIFSIADNKIDDWEHVLYLRKFEKLRSINFTGNPCTLQENYNQYVLAFLPQVTYFSYAMIQEEDRTKAVEMHWRTIAKVEDDEAKAKATLEGKIALEKKNATDSVAFVDHLDGDELFQLLFLHDIEGNALKNINGDTLAVFEEYRKNVSGVSHELYLFGIEQHSQRAKEIEIFSGVVAEARDNVRDGARKLIDSIQKHRDDMFAKFDKDINEMNEKLEESTSNQQSKLQLDEKMARIRAFAEEFNQFLSTMWTKLLYNEVVLYEQIEDLNETFKLNMEDMRDAFVESLRAFFSQLRNVAVDYRDAINRVVSIHISNIAAEESTMPAHLLDICGDMNILSNTLNSSHDFHLQTIDGREDEIIHRIKEWFENFIEQLRKMENGRHRHRILEISHFLQYQRESVHNHILATDNLALDVLATLEG